VHAQPDYHLLSSLPLLFTLSQDKTQDGPIFGAVSRACSPDHKESMRWRRHVRRGERSFVLNRRHTSGVFGRSEAGQAGAGAGAFVTAGRRRRCGATLPELSGCLRGIAAVAATDAGRPANRTQAANRSLSRKRTVAPQHHSAAPTTSSRHPPIATR